MRSVLMMIALSAICAQAAPQFNGFGFMDNWGSRNNRQTENERNNENEGLNRRVFSMNSAYQKHRPEHYERRRNRDYQDTYPHCWDPAIHPSSDRSQGARNPQYPNEYYNHNDPGLHYDKPLVHHPHQHDDFHGPWNNPNPLPGPPPPHHHHEHGPPPPPHHHHEHGPPPPHHHDPHHHHHGPPPPHHHQHGPPPHHHHHERLPPPPHHFPHNSDQYELELCQDNGVSTVTPSSFETTTHREPEVISVSSTPRISTVPNTSENLKDEITRTSTQSTVAGDLPTTEFDWNNFVPDGASADNTGGVGSIDFRGLFQQPH